MLFSRRLRCCPALSLQLFFWPWLAGTPAGLLLRVLGNLRYGGFTRQVRHTTFARLDTRYYTPLRLLLAASRAALAVAGYPPPSSLMFAAAAPTIPPALPLRDGRVLAWGIPLLGTIIAAIQVPAGVGNGWPALGIHWLFSLYFTTGYWLADRALWRWLLRRLPRADQTARRLWSMAALALLLAGVMTVALQLPPHWLWPTWFPIGLASLLELARFSLMPTAVVLTLYESAYFFRQWQANQRRADQLAQAATQAQLDALARQLDPHFLFNSLNTLAALIEPGNEPAQHYVEGLADVYRYVLMVRQRPTVPLAEELAFVRTYLALQQVRFGEGLRVEYQVESTDLPRRVAPLSVQELVENALKHNEASRARPLALRIVAGGGSVRVENTYQPRPPGLVAGTGTGLANLRQRLALLGAAAPVAVAQAGGTFSVTLPLL